ncbi:MAG TPA: zincin-like metallopeptidase domain-containing protein [Polaromonas sp.]|uniref:ArdC family protein n=1 Tax=Polaromonas sp. TaxID=1869339 RepID=UPI002D236C20|nr:zincin-like metallopeptidase domain-containing protein [Polaromonas sp.]HYW57450.1 zincin-like metallopeptidase domain-containing protein [Polaromonas sp.]
MDIREQITSEIVALMSQEGGAPPWRKSWSSGYLHCNASSGATYKGINQLILAIAGAIHGDARWLTYRQAEYMGLQVRKGERGTRIVKMVEVNRRQAAKEADADGEVVAEEGNRALVMKAYTVFNASQIDGMAPMPVRDCTVTCADAVQQIIFGLQGTGLKVNFGQGFQPCYLPRTDEVRIPPASEFTSLEDFHATLLHEAAGHGSQAVKRLAMMSSDVPRFGSAEYARLELIAELASAQLGAQLGLPMGPSLIASHAGYLASWLQVLKGDKNEIFRAAANAQKICDYVSKLAVEAQPLVVPPAMGETRSEVAAVARPSRLVL